MASSCGRAYRKAASRLSPRMSPSALSALDDELAKIVTGAPTSAFSIPESVRQNPLALLGDAGSKQPGAVVRSIGTSRRVFLLNPALTPTEIDGLAYRIRTMASNDSINSVVVANPLEDADARGDMSDNLSVLSSFLDEAEVNLSLEHGGKGPFAKAFKSGLHETIEDGLGMPYVSTGYDAREIHGMGMQSDSSRLERELMIPLMQLSQAVRGSYDVTINSSASKVPLISFPNGLVTDAGYALLMGSYVLATQCTAFRILNPLRGLAFDPIGLSYLLPRIGWEFDQPSSEHSDGCAVMLALAGYKADAQDMVSTGLATHYVGGPSKLNILERALANLNSFENQSLHAPPKYFYGTRPEAMTKPDINDDFKNVAVANVIQHVTEYDAAGAGEYGCDLRDELDDETGLFLKDKDPSLVMPHERIQMMGEYESDLVNWSATFREVFEEPTVEGIMERLREIAATKAELECMSGCEEDVMVAEQALSLVTNMQQRSPLAMCVILELLQKGKEEGATLESCMEREKRSQMRLFSKENGDYDRWAKSRKGVGLVEIPLRDSFVIREKDDLFSSWTHSSVKGVTDDEVAEIVGI